MLESPGICKKARQGKMLQAVRWACGALPRNGSIAVRAQNVHTHVSIIAPPFLGGWLAVASIRATTTNNVHGGQPASMANCIGVSSGRAALPLLLFQDRNKTNPTQRQKQRPKHCVLLSRSLMFCWTASKHTYQRRGSMPSSKHKQYNTKTSAFHALYLSDLSSPLPATITALASCFPGATLKARAGAKLYLRTLNQLPTNQNPRPLCQRVSWQK